MSDLIVMTYESAATAEKAFNKIGELQKMQLVEMEDAALAESNEKGKVKVKQTLESKYTGASAVWGGFWGLLIGLIFGGPIFWLLFGALLGGIFGRSADLGVDNKFIKEVGDSLEPGGAAIFMLIRSATYDKFISEMSEFGGTVYQTSFSYEDEDKLKAALKNEKVAAAADESVEIGS